jgi:hypothetical protein
MEQYVLLTLNSPAKFLALMIRRKLKGKARTDLACGRIVDATLKSFYNHQHNSKN